MHLFRNSGRAAIEKFVAYRQHANRLTDTANDLPRARAETLPSGSRDSAAPMGPAGQAVIRGVMFRP